MHRRRITVERWPRRGRATDARGAIGARARHAAGATRRGYPSFGERGVTDFGAGAPTCTSTRAMPFAGRAPSTRARACFDWSTATGRQRWGRRWAPGARGATTRSGSSSGSRAVDAQVPSSPSEPAHLTGEAGSTTRAGSRACVWAHPPVRPRAPWPWIVKARHWSDLELSDYGVPVEIPCQRPRAHRPVAPSYCSVSACRSR